MLKADAIRDSTSKIRHKTNIFIDSWPVIRGRWKKKLYIFKGNRKITTIYNNPLKKIFELIFKINKIAI